ncbi:MAG: serine hydrolase [Pseudomonadota bacterium]
MIRALFAALAPAFLLTACASQEAEEPDAPPAAVVMAFDKETITPLIVEGVRNFETNEPVEANDPVRIASISKLIMALATMRVVDEGKVDLDADVSDYLGFELRAPGYPDTPVTLAQVLMHRAGLRDAGGYVIPLGESLETKFDDPDSWYADAPAGKAPFEYSNLGSSVVATALEGATGERYDELVERTVFAPIGVEGCLNWVGCSDETIARAVALYRHTGEPARDYPGDLPPGCSIPVAEGMQCALESYKPGTNASIFSPQGGVRIGMTDLAKIGQAILTADETGFLKPATLERFMQSPAMGMNAEQEFFCAYGLGLQQIEVTRPECLDKLIGGETAYVGHPGEAYGLQSGLYVSADGEDGYLYFRTQVPPPAGGEDTGGFVQGEKDLMARAMAVLAKQKAE